ncbi:MAG: CBM35 domain-containing protein, partial [Cyanobacteria bacterium J06555_13]
VSYDQGNTWESAPANQIEIPKGTVDLTQVRIAIGDDDVIEPDESFDVSVATVVAGSVDAAVASATVTIVDDDTALPPFIQTFQAEDAVLVGAVVKPGREAEGRGYVDYTNSSGDYAEWTVDVPKTGVYELSWRYQNGSSNRPLALDVNGSMLNPNVDFLNTGGWTKRDWASVSQSVALEAGSNTIRLTATGQSGANFDSMTVSNIDSSLLAVAPTEAPTSLASLEPEGADAIAQRDDITGLSVTADAFSIEAADPLADSLLAAPAPTARSFASRSLASQPLAMRSTALPVQPIAAQSLAIQSTAASPEVFAVEAATASAFDTTLQAEDALVSGPDINTGRGSEGTGYVDYRNSSGDFIEWTVDAPTAGAYELSWRYQNGSSNRPLALEVNGNAANPGVDFPNTGGWNRDSWDFVSQAVTLDAGPNTIRLTAIGQSGANFDYMRVVSAGSDVIISDATATEGVDDYLVFDVSLSVASEDIVTLELAAVDGTAKGGLIAEFPLDPTGDPVDYANAEFEVEVITDGVATWQAATNGTEVTFAAGETERKVRLAINDDGASESTVPETLQLTVNSVLAGDVRSFSDTGTGSIVDDELPAPDVLISDATATEGIDDYLVFDVSLSVPSDEPITVALTAMDGTAKGGAIADFPLDPAGDPVDYAKTEFEVSIDGGATWTATANGEVTFAAGTTERKVRLAINDDEASENDVESLQLFSSIVSGEVESTADTGTGSIVDNEIPAPDVLISDASATEGTDDYLVFN